MKGNYSGAPALTITQGFHHPAVTLSKKTPLAARLDMLDILRDSVHQRRQGNIGRDVRTKMEGRLYELLARPPVHTREDGKGPFEVLRVIKALAKA